MAGKIKGLQQWCRKMTEGYPRVDIANFTTAWRDGLAFCAIIHRFRPDLIDFDSLSPENVFENCKMAFEIAEKELSIPAFLEADDMVRLKVPDKLSIITYVSQYYNYLHSLPQLGGPGVKSKVSGKTVSGVKRPTDSDSTQGPISKKATTVESKENAAPAKVAASSAGDRCGICYEHVYLIERHMEDGKLYHRSCFRRSELSPANKVYTRSPFMSPSLSSEAQKLVVSKAENKTSVLSKADRDGLVTNLQRQMDNQPMKAESDTKLSRKLDFVGSKHPIDEPAREDTKKSKMQPRILFDDEKTRKASTEKDKSAAYSSKQSSEANKLFPLSSKEAHKLEKRQEDTGSEKALKEQPSNTKLNISVFSQQKNKATQEIPPPAAASVPANNKSQNKSDNISGASKISVAALSLLPLSESSQSKSKSSIDKDGQKMSKEAEKLAVSKDIQKSSEKKNVDIATSKSNLLPDIHNLQKLFSGKPADSAESAAPDYPRAKPRNSKVRSENQESSKDTKPSENGTAAPKPVPRNSVLGMSAPKQPEMSSEVKKSAFETEASGRSSASKPLAAGISLSVSKNAQSQLSTSTMSPPFDSTYKAPSTEKILSETKISVTGKNTDAPRNVPLINQPHSLQQKIGANKILNQNSLYVKSANKSGHASVLNASNVIKTTTTTSLSTTTSNSTVHTTLTPAKLQSSTPLSQVQSENKFISSRNPINKTVIETPTSYTGNLVSQTQTAHTSAGVSNSGKLMANTNGTQSTKNVEKSVVTQMSKDTPKTVVNTPKLQTPNKMQEALSVFSSGKPVSSALGITFTNNSAREDANLTKPQKVKDSSSKPALSHITDIHSKEKTISNIPSQNINQNRQAKPASGNLLNSKDSQQKSAVKNYQTDSKQTDKHESKGLSTVKTSAVSSSKEDILDINNVKLKRVMPEQREIQNEQKTSMYDVKLKKVDVIKGDSKWDSSSQKPSQSVDVMGASHEHRTAGSHFSNGEINKEVSSKQGMDTKAAALSAGVSNSHATTAQKITSELPQWKKAAEEKQWKLRDNVVGSEHKTDNVKHLKHNNDNITPLTFDTKTSLASNGKTSKSERVGVLSLLKTPSETVTTEKEPAKALTTHKYGNKVSPTAEDPGMVKKLDWQLEAEKRMAAIANFDKGIVGKLKVAEKSETASSDSPGNQQVQRNTAAHKTEMSKDNKNNDNVRLNGEAVTGNSRVTDKTTTSVLEKSVMKAKETELKVAVNKLKSTVVQEINKEVELSIDTKQTNSGETEDFRQVLHQLKHVTTEDIGKLDSTKSDSETCLPSKQTSHDVHTPTAHRTIPNNTINKNNNNNQNISDKNHISDMHNTQVLNKNTSLAVKTPEFEDLADENGNVRKDGIFEVSEKKHSMGKSKFAEKGNTTSPKVKRKLSIPDDKTREMPSPSFPAQRKKIQITSKFDFEKSSDFEQSLTLSTARLTIEENSTPEKLMSSPSSQDTLSPQHISALELQQQLHNIDTRLTELELKGRELENSIRKVNSLDEDDDNLMIEWFTIINEKNDLVRKEADLIYLSKEQELEDEQEQIESQLYYLMTKPDECKSPEEKEEEDYLINRKIALVEQRNKIIDSMDEDRIRYEAEDKNIEVTLKDKGYWKDSTGTLKAVKGKKVANSMFYT